MRYGCMVMPPNILLPEAYGYDYVELTLSHVMDLSDEAFDELLTKARSMRINVEVMSLIFPLSGYVKVVGPEADERVQNEYFERALKRAAQLGACVLVFGSAQARAIPEGFSREEAERQTLGFLRRLAAMCRPLGMHIVIEPLKRASVNYIHTVPEAVALANQCADDAVSVLCDLYHMDCNDEPMDDIVAAGGMLRHVHMARPGDRDFPTLSDDYDYKPFFDALERVGYNERITIEAFGNVEAGLENGIRFLEARIGGWKHEREE